MSTISGIERKEYSRLPDLDLRVPRMSERKEEEWEKLYNFPYNFERLLGLHRLTNERAAELLEVSPTTVSYWRNGKQTPDSSSLNRLLRFFEIDFFAIMGSNWEGFFAGLGDQARFERVEHKIRG
jgi:hypothetical protein